MEAWPIKALKAAPISRKLEIAQNAKSCRATCGKPYRNLRYRLSFRDFLSDHLKCQPIFHFSVHFQNLDLRYQLRNIDVIVHHNAAPTVTFKIRQVR